jgi:hypothetical protein
MTFRLRWPAAPSGRVCQPWVVGLAVGQAFATCSRGGEAGFHALAEKVALEPGDPCQHGGHHPTMGCVEREGHAAHGHNRDFPACEPVEGVEQILSGAPPPGKLADQNGIYLPGLREIEDLIAGGAIGGSSGSRFLEYADCIIAATFCECGQCGDLPLTRLVGCRNPGIDSCAVSQLNPLGFWPCKPMILPVRISS